MKWKAVVEDYFTFNKVQRRSIILALSIIVGCLVIRFSYHYFAATETIPVDTAFLQEAARLTQPDTTKPTYASRYNKEENEATYREPSEKYTTGTYKPKGELFPFDPNTLTPEGWKRLGVRDKTVATIQNYLSKGGHFRQPDDIKRIYGLYPNEAERLLPYVKIAATNLPPSENRYAKTENAPTPYKPTAPKTIDINTADTSAFIALPGIGSKLASRIVGFRDKLGGFYTIEQIGETYGLPDSVFQKIKSRLAIGTPILRKININTADANMLKANPYIRWNIANAIYQYRQQHSNYTSLNDLKKIALIDEQLLEKIQPYLTIE